MRNATTRRRRKSLIGIVAFQLMVSPCRLIVSSRFIASPIGRFASLDRPNCRSRLPASPISRTTCRQACIARRVIPTNKFCHPANYAISWLGIPTIDAAAGNGICVIGLKGASSATGRLSRAKYVHVERSGAAPTANCSYRPGHR